MVWIKIRVMPVVAVARPPTGIDGKLRQVSEPMSDQVWVDSGRSAAHQRAKRVEIRRSRSLGDQIGVEEGMVSDLIIGVIVDVLIHVFVQRREGLGVIWVASAAWNFVILDAAEFVVLYPKVGLEYLQRSWEPEQCRVSR